MKVNRDAFLYLAPKSPTKDFAQCSTCAAWTTSAHNTCVIHGHDVKVEADDTCGFYLKGISSEHFSGCERTLVTPEESGLSKQKSRCENCQSFDGANTCLLYAHLNKTSELFELDEIVEPQACCNAQREKSAEQTTETSDKSTEVSKNEQYEDANDKLKSIVDNYFKK